MATPAAPQRMDPAERREYLMNASAEYIAEHGVDVSLDDIAREAGISPPLMRHYFKNRDGLLVALIEQGIGDILTILAGPDQGDLGHRLGAYLGFIDERPWAHRLWMAAPSKELVLAPMVADARRKLQGAALGIRWEDQSQEQRFQTNAWVAVVESAVQNWIEDGGGDIDELVGHLLGIAVRLEIPNATDAVRARAERR